MFRPLVCVCALVSLFLPSVVRASTIAFDSQADPAYASWDPGDNGGTGWGGGWTFRNQSNTVLTTTNSNRGWFVASSTGNNGAGGDSNSDGDINSPSTGRAWGVYSNTADQVYAIRPFSGALSVGQTVTWDMDNGNIASGQVVGLRFLSNPSDITSRVFEARFVGGESFYTTVAGPGTTTILPFSREGLHLEYTLTSPTTFSLDITRLVNGATQTITGTNVNASEIHALAFKNQFAGTGSATDAYLNNISIVPEPGALGIVVLGAMLVGRRRDSTSL